MHNIYSRLIVIGIFFCLLIGAFGEYGKSLPCPYPSNNMKFFIPHTITIFFISSPPSPTSILAKSYQRLLPLPVTHVHPILIPSSPYNIPQLPSILNRKQIQQNNDRHLTKLNKMDKINYVHLQKDQYEHYEQYESPFNYYYYPQLLPPINDSIFYEIPYANVSMHSFYIFNPFDLNISSLFNKIYVGKAKIIQYLNKLIYYSNKLIYYSKYFHDLLLSSLYFLSKQLQSIFFNIRPIQFFSKYCFYILSSLRINITSYSQKCSKYKIFEIYLSHILPDIALKQQICTIVLCGVIAFISLITLFIIFWLWYKKSIKSFMKKSPKKARLK